MFKAVALSLGIAVYEDKIGEKLFKYPDGATYNKCGLVVKFSAVEKTNAFAAADRALDIAGKVIDYLREKCKETDKSNFMFSLSTNEVKNPDRTIFVYPKNGDPRVVLTIKSYTALLEKQLLQLNPKL